MEKTNNILVVEIKHLDDIYRLTKLNTEKTYVLNIMFKESLNDLTSYCKIFSYYNALRIMNKTFPTERIILSFYANSYSDFYRLERMLFAQSINNKNIYIKITKAVASGLSFAKNYIDADEKEKIHDDEKYYYYHHTAQKVGSFGNIQPIISICGHEASAFLNGDIDFNELISVDSNSSLKELEQISDEAVNNILNSTLSIIDENTYLKAVFGKEDIRYEGKTLLSEDEFFELVEKTTNNLNKPTLANNNSSAQIEFLKILTSHNIVRFLSQLSGVQGKSIPQQMKIELLNDFINKYKTAFVSLNFIAQYIWSDLLMNLTDDKQQLILTKNIKELDYSIIDKSLYDAIAYSEGVYQLIENSTIHTRFKNVTFMIRNHNIVVQNNTHKELSENVLIDNYKKRKELKDRFFPKSIEQIKTYKISEEIHNCLEIIICDSAFSSATGECAGIVNTFVSKSPQTRNNVKQVNQLFNLTLEKEAASKHYGIQLFEKNVILNNGIFYLTTPNVEEGKIRLEEYVSCFVNGEKKQHNSIVESSSDKTTRFTCYNILLPLGYKWDDINNKNFVSINEGNRWFNENSAFTSYPQYKTVEMDNDIINSKFTKGSSHSNITSIEAKDKVIKDLKNYFKEVSNDNDGSNCIMAFGINNYSYQKIELLAKAIFSFSFERSSEQETLIAVYFDSDSQINEFVRFFSIFYDKKGNIKDLQQYTDGCVGNCRSKH